MAKAKTKGKYFAFVFTGKGPALEYDQIVATETYNDSLPKGGKRRKHRCICASKEEAQQRAESIMHEYERAHKDVCCFTLVTDSLYEGR